MCPVFFNGEVLSSDQFDLFIEEKFNETIYQWIMDGLWYFSKVINRVRRELLKGKSKTHWNALNRRFPSISVYKLATVWFIKNLLKSHGLSGQCEEVFYDMPSMNALVDSEEKIYVASQYITIQHCKKEQKWVVESWGKFFYNRNWLS